jgi:hypothetical protein
MGRRRRGVLALSGTSVDSSRGGNVDDESVVAVAVTATTTTTTMAMGSTVSIEEAAGEMRRRASELRAEARVSEMAIVRGKDNAVPPLVSSSSTSIGPVEYAKLGGSCWEMTCVFLLLPINFSPEFLSFVGLCYFISTFWD